VRQEPSVAPDPADGSPQPGGNDHVRHADLVRARAGIEKIARSRLEQDVPLSKLEGEVEKLRSALAEVVSEERDLRIERVRLSTRRDNLRKAGLGLRRDRLEKEAKISSMRSRISALLDEVSATHVDEVERLGARVEDLKDMVEAFREALLMHRRDRNRVLRLLHGAQSSLQDLLTTGVIQRIVELERESGNERGSGRVGKAGIAAELLGRLLVLEREESHLGGRIMRRRVDPEDCCPD